MPISVKPEHRQLQEVVRSYLKDHQAADAARAALDGRDDHRPEWVSGIAAMGWLGLHVPEELGGAGAGLFETALVVEELGRSLAPGPLLSTLAASATLLAAGGTELRAALLPRLADGTLTAAIAVSGTVTRDRHGRFHGAVEGVLGAGPDRLLLLPAGDDLIAVDAGTPGVVVRVRANLDRTQRCGRVWLDAVSIGPSHILEGAKPRATAICRILAAAQAAGGAAACLSQAVEYAKVREQFGRPIGSFQAVKHRCADMFVAAELAAAVAWDAARAADESDAQQAALAAAEAATVALRSFLRNAQSNIQVHGGIGFTWEHDAHLYLRRAAALLAQFGGSAAAGDVVRLRRTGIRRQPRVTLPEAAAGIGAEVRALADAVRNLPPADQQTALVARGYALPHLPPPWGRGADAMEQLVIEQELAGIARPDYGVGAWIIPTLRQHGTAEQLARWMEPSLRLDLIWCQMFSEPGAGSDAAAISTRATRGEGGWRVTGQKVWTSRAMTCNRGLATIRTDSSQRKHDGITLMVIDLSAPGVEVRPLREASDEYGFGEIFLDDVYVPDEDILGAVGDGWKLARTALGNERLTVGGTDRFGGGILDTVEVLEHASPAAVHATSEVGQMASEVYALEVLTIRAAERALAGQPGGPEGAVTKLVRGESTQRSAALALEILGPTGALEVLGDGSGNPVAKSIVRSQMTTIGGGTSEILRNQIAERILGLPREAVRLP
jgi:3-oxochol-4-en-24-oyl-CoA dehydrogenase